VHEPPSVLPEQLMVPSDDAVAVPANMKEPPLLALQARPGGTYTTLPSSGDVPAISIGIHDGDACIGVLGEYSVKWEHVHVLAPMPKKPPYVGAAAVVAVDMVHVIDVYPLVMLGEPIEIVHAPPFQHQSWHAVGLLDTHMGAYDSPPICTEKLPPRLNGMGDDDGVGDDWACTRTRATVASSTTASQERAMRIVASQDQAMFCGTV
jgi:hypothetical protein